MGSWGTGASCQPPVTLIMSTPAFSYMRAISGVSELVLLPVTKSLPAMRTDSG